MIYSSLAQAPSGILLTVTKIADKTLEAQLGRMGIFTDSSISRLDQEVDLQTVRIKGPKGEVVLGGGMGGKVVAHLDDGRILPLSEMQPGETGHIEGVTGGEALTETLAALGLKDDDEIELIRKLPPMEYVTSVEGRGRIRMPEGMAAKILGHMEELSCQFANARAATPFVVDRIIGGERARRAIDSLDIEVGTVLTLQSVEKAANIHMAGHDRVVLHSKEGLRLFLRKDQAELVIVIHEDQHSEE